MNLHLQRKEHAALRYSSRLSLDHPYPGAFPGEILPVDEGFRPEMSQGRFLDTPIGCEYIEYMSFRIAFSRSSLPYWLDLRLSLMTLSYEAAFKTEYRTVLHRCLHIIQGSWASLEFSPQIHLTLIFNFPLRPSPEPQAPSPPFLSPVHVVQVTTLRRHN